MRKFSEATCRNYIRHIAEFARFPSRSPDAATADDVRRFQVHMSEIGARPTARPRRYVSFLALPSIGLRSPGISPAYTTRGRYRACFHPRR